jgi:hypothetical protein
VVVDVDEARGDDEAVRIDRPRGGLAVEPAQGRDPAVLDPDVPEVRRVAGAVHDAPAADEQVEVGSRGRREDEDRRGDHARQLTSASELSVARKG